MNQRVVEPEWLDELPADESRALASRRDLRRLNVFMNHAGLLTGALRQFPKPERVLDMGAGDGWFTLRMARAAKWHDVEVVLLDRAAIVSAEVRSAFEDMQCSVETIQSDVLDGFERIGRIDCIVTNLFLHHFAGTELTPLLAQIATHCSLFAACEPRRSIIASGASRLVGLIGCNDVTRHDAVASVRAGFRRKEISEHWPVNSGWSLAERSAGLFSHLFVARKV